jgi:hypothetical protein
MRPGADWEYDFKPDDKVSIEAARPNGLTLRVTENVAKEMVRQFLCLMTQKEREQIFRRVK